MQPTWPSVVLDVMFTALLIAAAYLGVIEKSASGVLIGGIIGARVLQLRGKGPPSAGGGGLFGASLTVILLFGPLSHLVGMLFRRDTAA